MYFRFPEGTTVISVEQQTFTPEAKDKDGNNLFRAPDHFAPIILDLPGFGRGDPVEGSPEDLPPTDPRRATEVDKLSAQREADKEEITRLRQQLGEAWRARDGAATELAELREENEELKKALAEHTKPTKPATVATLSQAKPSEKK
jgi:hypothetical protein